MYIGMESEREAKIGKSYEQASAYPVKTRLVALMTVFPLLHFSNSLFCSISFLSISLYLAITTGTRVMHKR